MIHAIAGQPVFQIVLLTIMVGLGFWLQGSYFRLATIAMAAAWIFMFTIYFQAQREQLAWQMMAVGISVPIMMAVRFLIWPEDRPVSTSLILRSHQLILIRAAQQAGRSKHRADVLGWLHKSMLPVIQSLATHTNIDSATRATLLDQRRALEIELLRAPSRGTEIAKILTANPVAKLAELSPQAAALASYRESPETGEEEDSGHLRNSSVNISRRRAIQVSAAVMPAALAGFVLSHERWPWAVLVAMFMFFGTESSGRLLSKGVQNIVGVMSGFVIAITLSHILPSAPWLELSVIGVLAFLAFYLIPIHYAAGMAAVTALIGQALAVGGGDITVLLQLRLTEVMAGAAFGLFAGLCVMPERAGDQVRRACSGLLNDVANILDPDQTGPSVVRLQRNLDAAYMAADFGRLAGLLIDGAGMRAALLEMGQLKYLIGLYRHLDARSEVEIPAHYLYELARQCRTAAVQVVNRKQEALTPISWPQNDAQEFGVLAAIEISIQAIAKQA